MAAIRFENVSKSYPIYDSPGDRLKELVTFNRLEFHRNFWALHDVSFEVARGETFSKRTACMRTYCGNPAALSPGITRSAFL